jgi:hypothetical protein
VLVLARCTDLKVLNFKRCTQVDDEIVGLIGRVRKKQRKREREREREQKF